MAAQNPSLSQSSAADVMTAMPPNQIPIRGGGCLAPGFRFHPTDDELVNYYLKRKVCKRPLCFNAIADLDVYKVEPWELAEKSSLKSKDEEWYFYTPLDKKYCKSARMNRSTKQGYWKATGKDRAICSNNQIVAMKKTLVFHNGRAPFGERTNWVMHEYRLASDVWQRAGSTEVGYVLCRVFHKTKIGPPSRSCYAPFVEEEWDDEETVVPGAMEEAGLDDSAEAGAIVTEKVNANDLPTREQNALILHKEEPEQDRPMPDLLNVNPPFPLIHCKRRCLNDGSSSSNGSENSLQATLERSSSTMTTADTKMTSKSDAPNASVVSTLLELSLPLPVVLKGNIPVLPSTPDAAAYLQSTFPPIGMKLINDLQSEIQKMSAERENLRLELMSTQAMVNIFQFRIECLKKENEELKKALHRG